MSANIGSIGFLDERVNSHMPSCTKCHKYSVEEDRCTVPEGSPIRKCVIALLEGELEQIKPDMRVLEIGCGSWDFVKKKVEDKGGHWFGIDVHAVNEKGVPTVASHIASIDNLPYEDNHFDYVIGNQTLEHWHDTGTSYLKGFREIYRVMKPGGILSLNVPIHLHGDGIFVRGDIQAIFRLFNPHMWLKLSHEEWRKDYEPLEPFEGFKTNGYSNEELTSDQVRPSSWILQISCRKKGNMSMARCFYYQVMELFQ